jgi:hypothetical protein
MGGAPMPESNAGEPEIPAYIGRYRVTGVLGSGAFATVYLGEDEPEPHAVSDLKDT